LVSGAVERMTVAQAAPRHEITRSQIYSC